MSDLPPSPQRDDSLVLPIRDERLPAAGLRGSLPLTAAGTLVDLSLEGLGLDTSEALPVGESYRLDLNCQGDQLTIDGTLRWQQLSALDTGIDGQQLPRYRTGIQLPPSTSERRSVSRFLDRHAGPQNGERVPPRWHLRRPAVLALQAEFPFEVSTVSRSGMLIDVPVRLGPGEPVELALVLPEEAKRDTDRLRVQAETVEAHLLRTDGGAERRLALRFVQRGEGYARLRAWIDHRLQVEV